MYTKEDVTEFYTNNFDIMYKYMRNQGKLTKEDIEDAIQDAFVYFLEDPSKFSPDYVYNRLNQLSLNNLRDRDRYTTGMMELYREVSRQNNLSGVYISTEDLNEVIELEIANQKTDSHRDILTRYYILGENPIDMSEYKRGTVRQTIWRFECKLKERYDIDEWQTSGTGHRI